MGFVQDCARIMEFVNDGPQANVRKTNAALFDIFEGNLLPYIEADMRKQFSPKYFEEVRHRIPPINILKKLVDKLSKIYKDAPTRTIDGGGDDDKALLAWYETELDCNARLACADEFFSLSKTALLQVAIDVPNRKPILRCIPGDRFTPFSTNSINPTKPTHFATMEGKDADGNQLFGIYSADEFALVNEKGEIQTGLMAAAGLERENPYERLPFVYVNRSQNLLIPKCDTDTLAMTILFPLMLGDLNAAAMFQSFSIMYLLNASSQDLSMSPNALWTIVPTDPEKEAKVGSIKPEVDIDKVLGLIQSQFALWLNSRGIRPGAVGQLTPENFSSGISKMVDEMDTSEERQKQVGFFQVAERELWDLVLKSMHPVWVNNGWVENRTLFDATATVTTAFHEQLPLVSRGALVKDLDVEVKSGFTTRKRAIKRLNPDMADEDVDALLAEIEAERRAGAPAEAEPKSPPMNEDDNNGDEVVG